MIQPSGVQPSGVQPSGVQPSGVQPSGVQPSGVQPPGCLSHRVSSRPGVSHLVSAASALSASRSAVGSVRPGAGDAGGGLSRPAGQYRLRSDRVSLGCGCGRARPDDRRGGQAVARIARRSRPSQCRKRAEHDVAAPAAWLCAHAVRGAGTSVMAGCRPDSVRRLRSVGRHQCRTPGWTGPERATGSAGRRPCGPRVAQAGSERCRLGVHFILFRSSLHPRCRPGR
jgi:hypothetical protein